MNDRLLGSLRAAVVCEAVLRLQVVIYMILSKLMHFIKINILKFSRKNSIICYKVIHAWKKMWNM